MAENQIDRLLSQLNTSGLSQKDNPLFQIISELIKAVRDISVSSGGGSGGGGGIANQSFITYGNDTATLPNSLQLIPGQGLAYNRIAKKLILNATERDVQQAIEEQRGQRGFPGDRGLQGVQGIVGPRGYLGEDGIVGPRGVAGVAGVAGATGAIGPRGLPGDCCDSAKAVGPVGVAGDASFGYGITQATVAGDFTGTGAMTWTAVTVVDYSYVIFGKTMIIFYSLGGSNVGGVVNIDLKVTIPRGQIAKKTQQMPFIYLDAGTFGVGQAYVAAAGTQLNFRKGPGTTWTATAGGNTFCIGTHIFEVQ